MKIKHEQPLNKHFKKKTISTKQQHLLKGGAAGNSRDAADADPEID